MVYIHFRVDQTNQSLPFFNTGSSPHIATVLLPSTALKKHMSHKQIIKLDKCLR